MEELYSVSNEEMDILVKNLESEMSNAFLSKNSDKFLALFDIDVVNRYYTQKWFDGYAIVFATPVKCQVKIHRDRDCCSESFNSEIEIYLKYEEYDSEKLIINSKLQYLNVERKLMIIESTIILEQPHWKKSLHNNTEKYDISMIKFIFQKAVDTTQEFCISKDLIHLLKDAEDTLNPSMYARAIIKSIRYRTSNKEIDSACLLADLMSRRTIKLSKAMSNFQLDELLEDIESIGKRYLIPKTYTYLRTIDKDYFPAKELSLLPLASLEEVLYQLQKNNRSEVSCIEILSFYLSVLILNGLEVSDAYIVVQPFHYLATLKINEKPYIVSFNDVVPMSKNRLYGDTIVLRVFNQLLYYDPVSEQTNMQQKDYDKMTDFYKNNFSVFSVTPFELESSQQVEGEKIPTLKHYSDVDQLAFEIKKYVYSMSQKYPKSFYTWAKYSYQTVLVKKPQAYILCSLRSAELKSLMQVLKNMEELITWSKVNLGSNSIFEETDRIMTASQVLSNMTGSQKDIANFIYTCALISGLIKNGGIIITRTTSYVMFGTENKEKIFNVNTFSYCESIEEKVLLFFNEKEVYNSLFGDSKECIKEAGLRKIITYS